MKAIDNKVSDLTVVRGNLCGAGRGPIARAVLTITLLVALTFTFGSVLADHTPNHGKGKGGGGGGGGGGDGGGGATEAEIAYVDKQGLRVMNADGSNKTLLLSVGSSDDARHPVWSPDGTQLAFAARLSGAAGIYTINLDGTGLTMVTSLFDGSLLGQIDWSRSPTPDGEYKIAFTDRSPGETNTNLFAVNPDGTGLVQLSDTPDLWEAYPAWSSDGTRLAVVRILDGLYELESDIDESGSLIITGEALLLSDNTGSNAFPRWANANDWIVLSYFLSIAILDLSVEPPQLFMLAASTDTERWASFSPDDLRIAFHRTGKGIYTMNTDGTGLTQIAGKFAIDPNWRPLLLP